MTTQIAALFVARLTEFYASSVLFTFRLMKLLMYRHNRLSIHLLHFYLWNKLCIIYTYIFCNSHLAPLIRKPLRSRDFIRITNASYVKWPKRTSSSYNVIGLEMNLWHNANIEKVQHINLYWKLSTNTNTVNIFVKKHNLSQITTWTRNKRYQ